MIAATAQGLGSAIAPYVSSPSWERHIEGAAQERSQERRRSG